MSDRHIKGERLSDLLPTLAYSSEDELFLLDDHNLGFGYVCLPLEGFDEKAADRINVLLNGDWPDETLMQFNLIGSPDISREMEALLRSRHNRSGSLLQEIADKRVDFLQRGTDSPIEPSTGTYLRNFTLMVTVKVPIESATPSEADITRVTNLKNAFHSALKTVGLEPQTIDAGEYLRVMNILLNWGEGASWRHNKYLRVDDDKFIRDQVMDFDSSVSVDTDGLWLGDDRRVKNLSVKRFPKRFQFGAAASYLGDLLSGNRGIRENCMISATIHFPTPHKTNSAMERKRQWAVNQAYGPMLKFVPMLAAKKHGYDILFDAMEDGDRVVKLHLGLTLFARDQEEATAAVSSARSYWGELGFSIMEDRYYNLPLFLNRLPFGADLQIMKDSFRYKSMATRHAITLLPLYADWKGTGSPVLSLVSRNGQYMNVSLFDSGSNYNGVIAAQSGSGKSFLTNDIISNYLACGGKAWVIDVGRSYKDLCDFIHGDFVEFNKESQICLNPFPLVKDYSEEEDILVGLLTAMAAPTENLSDFQIARLKKALASVWHEYRTEATVDLIADHCIADEDKRVQDIGHQLYPFTTKGEYGKYFHGENNMDFQNPFTVLELEELKGRAHLQQVVLLQLIYQIQNDMYLGKRDRPKCVIIDEAWSLLTSGNIASFIEHGFRRFRKYGGAALVVTQSVQDLYRNSTGEAIARNSANMYLLGQKSEDIAGLEREEKIALSKGGFQLLKTVHTVPGAYSEIFFLTEYGAGIGRLIVDPFSQLLYSTKPDDVQAIQDKRAQGYAVEEAIKAVMRDRGQLSEEEQS
jgi:conjugal transfer ATP-binding protein TraC